MLYLSVNTLDLNDPVQLNQMFRSGSKKSISFQVCNQSYACKAMNKKKQLED